MPQMYGFCRLLSTQQPPERRGALLPYPLGIFRFAAKAGRVKMQAAVTEDRATQGCDLSAGDGPKLAGAVLGSYVCRPPLPVVILLSPCWSYRLNPPSLF